MEWSLHHIDNPVSSLTVMGHPQGALVLLNRSMRLATQWARIIHVAQKVAEQIVREFLSPHLNADERAEVRLKAKRLAVNVVSKLWNSGKSRKMEYIARRVADDVVDRVVYPLLVKRDDCKPQAESAHREIHSRAHELANQIMLESFCNKYEKAPPNYKTKSADIVVATVVSDGNTPKRSNDNRNENTNSKQQEQTKSPANRASNSRPASNSEPRQNQTETPASSSIRADPLVETSLDGDSAETSGKGVCYYCHSSTRSPRHAQKVRTPLVRYCHWRDILCEQLPHG